MIIGIYMTPPSGPLCSLFTGVFKRRAGTGEGDEREPAPNEIIAVVSCTLW